MFSSRRVSSRRSRVGQVSLAGSAPVLGLQDLLAAEVEAEDMFQRWLRNDGRYG